MKHEGLIIGLLVVAVAIAAAGLVLGVAHPARQPRVVAATGTAEKSFVPDIAHLDLGVQTDAPEVQKAQQDNSTAMNAVLAALKAAGVKAEDIQTSSFYVNQNFDYSSGQSKPTGWRVSNTVTIRVQPDLVSAVIDAGSKAGANIFNSISFDMSNREELKAGLMKDAVANARAKALGTLEGTTHILGDIVAIVADWSGPSVIYAGAEGLGASSAGSIPMEAGTNILSVSVSVSFELN
ncbi:MAG: SIMPL domain-containing protein [Caldiserica bacterium]|nr:SIMPL domain-containing protein [Caldisericota bacterium]